MTTLVVSDVHLSEKKGRDTSRALAELIDSSARNHRSRNLALDLVLNGDILDLDVEHEHQTSPPAHVAAVLRAHPEFIQALANTRRRGTRVVWIAGNHDAALLDPNVRNAVDTAVGARLLHRSWFDRTRSGAHVEHGHLFDPACAGAPEATLGGVSARHAHIAFPGLDPENIDALPPRAYLAHLARCMMADPGHIRRAMIAGTSLLRSLGQVGRADIMPELALRAFTEHGGIVSPWLLEQHVKTTARPASAQTFAALDRWKDYSALVRQNAREGAMRVQELYGVPCVILGHTHSPEEVMLKNGAQLLNAGCWPHNDSGGSGGTYALHTAEGGTSGVYRWTGSAKLDPLLQSEASAG